ncbi:MAG TPA: cytochrome c oxidase subunit 3 [Candidatus Limnocylindrales bacterium]|nr:cytochrome c oxidase subunit 3 [Candidatus Limnocylindrales bacterium]HEU4672686.1 cytochrome c oxidase subunit 3 [Candidatus Limnocylindrales bacterium]
MTAEATSLRRDGTGEPSVHARRGIDTTIVGVLLFIASETMFFSGLFAAYFNARATHPDWPPQGIELEPLIASILTIVLVTSSVTMQLGVRAIRRGDRAGLQRWLAITLLLGAAFVAGQLYDYSTLDFSWQSGIYGAAFFTLTGFHGAHVTGGVIALAAMLFRANEGHFSARHHAAVEGVSAYWHFVDVIWLLLFSTLYVLR